MKTNYYALIMAGGVGSRFWPLSTEANPKQFHDMLGTGNSLLQQTFKRLSGFIPAQNIMILTNERYADLVMEQLPSISPEQVIPEPAMRNTAPCILYASLKIQKKDPEAMMIVAPSDHWIEDESAFAEDVLKCFAMCEKQNALCTLGITPTFPNTGFGYIEYLNQGDAPLKKVKQFREKPDYETARNFLEQGNFLWNAGIFIWGVHTIVAAFQEFQQDQYELFDQGSALFNTSEEHEFIRQTYPKAANLSIDYAILERSESIYVLPASFDWNDLGTWGSLYDKLEKDPANNAVVNASVLNYDASGNMIRSPKGKLVVVDGISDYIIVDKPDVLMIIPKSKEQDIKRVLGDVNKKFGPPYI